MIVLLPDPTLRGDIRHREEFEQGRARVERRRNRVSGDHAELRRGHMRPIVERRLIAEFLDRQVDLGLAAVLDDEAQRIGGLADDREVEPPFHEDGLGFRPLLRMQHHEHALLALGEHHLVGGHAAFAAGHGIEIELDAEIALGAHLDRRRGEAGRTHVLDRDDGTGLHQLEAGLQQELFGKGIADLNGGALLFGIGLEAGRGHSRAMDAIAPRLRAEIDDRVPDPRRFCVKNLVGAGEADGHGIDEDIAVVARVELGRAPDRRHAERIAVAPDAGHDAGDEMLRLRVRRVAEAQQVETSDRSRAHGEDVAQDAAHPRRRALVGFDVGGVVVALHLEDAGIAVADVDHAGVLTRALDDPGRGGRQRAQVQPRGFVRAVLVPHGREDAEFGEGRRAADEIEDALVFVGLQPVRGDEVWRDLGFGGWHKALGWMAFGAVIAQVPCACRLRRDDLGEIGLGKILALVEQHGANALRAGIGEAITHVQRGGVAAFSICSRGLYSQIGLPWTDLHDLERESLQKRLNSSIGCFGFQPIRSLQSGCRLPTRDCGIETASAGLDTAEEPIAIILSRENRNKGRSIYEDQSNSPERSSKKALSAFRPVGSGIGKSL